MTRAVLLAALVAPLVRGPALAEGNCDLATLVGYTLAFGKPIEGYIENGRRHSGFTGCEPERVLVFTDNTGVKCNTVVRYTHDITGLPTGFLFARSNADMKLCVAGQLLEVQPTN